MKKVTKLFILDGAEHYLPKGAKCVSLHYYGDAIMRSSMQFYGLFLVDYTKELETRFFSIFDTNTDVYAERYKDYDTEYLNTVITKNNEYHLFEFLKPVAEVCIKNDDISQQETKVIVLNTDEEETKIVKLPLKFKTTSEKLYSKQINITNNDLKKYDFIDYIDKIYIDKIYKSGYYILHLKDKKVLVYLVTYYTNRHLENYLREIFGTIYSVTYFGTGLPDFTYKYMNVE